MAQFTMNAPGRPKRGTSSQPPAKSTRRGATSGARIKRTIWVVEIAEDWAVSSGNYIFGAGFGAERAFERAVFVVFHDGNNRGAEA